jgi:Domain of unknown function (DUF4338)/Transposase DNA-binding
VLDAVRIAGRWVSKHVLELLSARAVSEHAPIRSLLVREFCRRTNWRNRRGQLCYSSANVALNRLEKQGQVKLPAPMPRSARTGPRQLVDDKEPLPGVPELGVGLPPITLQLIHGQADPDHLLWNRLIIHEHPLKAAPLVGAQLRYLLRTPQGVIGALGIGPAAYHLDCRDQWIGWDSATRQANLPQVIGLARFLIRPGVRSPNLASRIYRLLLDRVAQDWQERYGIKPVLIETFVDRSTQTGKSLSAANWRRLGQSCGRGRSSPSAQVCPKSTKDVWVYELAHNARKHLLGCPEPLVVPRSLFQGASTGCWVGEELDGLELGDVRLEKRFALMLQSRWTNPERSFFRSFGSGAAAKAAYRLIESKQADVSFGSLLAPHCQQTHRRMAAESLVLLAQDTTALSYNTLHQTTGLGSLGKKDKAGRGLWLHSMQAFRTDGIPLGCPWAKLWARSSQSDTPRRNEQAVSEKESGRWLEAYQSAARLARAMPQTHLIVCGDRESDIFELFDQTLTATPNLHLLVRAQHDRMLTEGHKLWGRLWEQPAQGTMQVRVPRRENRRARVATLEVRWACIEAAPPAVALKKSWQPITLWAVLAREIDPPEGQEAIEWMLLTDWKVDSLKMAVRLIRWYSLRWGIECWHQTLKDVCKIEKRQMESALALERALVLDMIVAWRALMICRLGKEHPDWKASFFYSPEELVVLEVYREKLPRHATTVPSPPTPEHSESQKLEDTAAEKAATATGLRPQIKPGVSLSSLTLFQANLLVAMLAGFWARKSDGHPGPKLVAEGLMILAALVSHQKLTRSAPLPHQPQARSKRPREPG